MVSSNSFSTPRVCFGEFAVDLEAGELYRSGQKVKLHGQPFQVLVVLLKQPGRIVTREELHQQLWSTDTFVDFEHGLNTAVNRLRETLRDSAEKPRFIETVPRRGYRFVGSVETPPGNQGAPKTTPGARATLWSQIASLRSPLLLGVIAALLGVSLLVFTRTPKSVLPVQRTLTRLTFEEGLQTGATWSPDGQFIAYSSNHGGKFDIWAQRLSGGDPVRVTHEPGQNWQPDWSPDGKYIVYRSEYAGGGLYVIPALGGTSRKITNFGVYPRWSPDGSRILFRPDSVGGVSRLYTVGLDDLQPRAVLEKFFAERNMLAGSAAWYPSGNRITVHSWDWQARAPVFWTVPLDEGEAIKTQLTPELLQRLGTIAIGKHLDDAKFSWSRAGNAIYFEPTFSGATNIWKIAVDPATLQSKGIERMTTGPGTDSGVDLSPDGKKLAFSAQNRRIQAWMASFDSRSGLLTPGGNPVTSSGVAVWHTDLSRDGNKIVFAGSRGDAQGVWQKSLTSGEEIQILGDDSYTRAYPMWSPDGTQVAYSRTRHSPQENNIVIWSSQTREERVITEGSNHSLYGWSPSGNDLVVSKWNNETQKAEVWLLSIASGLEKQQVAASPDYFLFQGQMSPDGRWMAFEAIRESPYGRESTIYAVPLAGGAWIRVTDGQQWDDKPRWSSDGKTIYFVSGRGGFYNVWGERFDSENGKITGVPFRITSFDTPALMIPAYISEVNLSITAHQLCVTTSQSSGGIWMLNNLTD